MAKSFVRKFTFENLPIHGAFVELTDAWNVIAAQKEYPDGIKQLLGELLAANVLLTTNIKLEGKIIAQIQDNPKVDLLVIDYVDCISPERSTFGEEWKGEGSIMRSLESMTGEFEMAIWTATQGNRESISSEVVNSDQMGGSIKKAQIAHVILSIGKTLEQKDNNLATLTLLKSRIGRDGVVFQNCKFNNEFLVIDTESQNTLLGHEEQQAQKNVNRAAEAYRKRQELLNK